MYKEGVLPPESPPAQALFLAGQYLSIDAAYTQGVFMRQRRYCRSCWATVLQ